MVELVEETVGVDGDGFHMVQGIGPTNISFYLRHGQDNNRLPLAAFFSCTLWFYPILSTVARAERGSTICQAFKVSRTRGVSFSYETLDMSKPSSGSRRTPSSDGNGDDGKKQLRHSTGDIDIRGEVKTEFPAKLVEEYVNANDKNERRERKRFRVELISLFLLLLVAIANIIATHMSSISADAARDAAKTARSALVDGQRAVVSAETFTIARQAEHGQVDALQFTTGWKNSGTTPTRNLETWSNWRVGMPETTIDKTFDFSDTWAQTGKPVPHERGFATSQTNHLLPPW